MRRSDKDASWLLLLRVNVLNDELRPMFQQWSPAMKLHDMALPWAA